MTSGNGVVDVDALLLGSERDDKASVQTQVVVEDALTLDVEGVGHYTLMWTPVGLQAATHGYTAADGLLGEVERSEGLALALGFALSEGLIQSLQDIRAMSVCADNPEVIQVQLHDPDAVAVQRRDVVVDSSCGICGPREILQDNVLGLTELTRKLSLASAAIPGLMESMRAGQKIFEQTGGSHAAAIFNSTGEIVAVAEDLGRHNALDKAIGSVLLERGSVQGCGVVLSSRLSLEMVLKAVRAGLEVMLAVSAPTSLAIDVAQQFGVTLCGFVRAERATVYTHPDRILS